jgi:hypothetical protein
MELLLKRLSAPFRAALTVLTSIALINPTTALARERDGSRDFDFNFGTWNTHIKRLAHPLSGSNDWVSYSGSVTVRKVWGGRANAEEVEADGPSHLELLIVRMYNKQARQWTLVGATSGEDTLEPPLWGDFEDGRGVFYGQDTVGGKTVLVRQTFYNVTSNSYSFEQAYSTNGGVAWEKNMLADLTRTSAIAPSEGSNSAADANHDFDFSYGVWHTSIRSLDTDAKPAPKWENLQGRVAWRKVWNGRGFLEELKAGSGSSGFEGLTLFLYSTAAHEWSQTFADSDTATFEPATLGGFHDGRGEFFSPGTFLGRNVLIRGLWSHITKTSHDYEIDYSIDGGTVWKPQFIAHLSRTGPGL